MLLNSPAGLSNCWDRPIPVQLSLGPGPMSLSQEESGNPSKKKVESGRINVE
jgi:hypothetical protein